MEDDSRFPPIEDHVIPIHVTQLDFNGVKFRSAHRKIVDCGVVLMQCFHLIIYFQMNSVKQRGKSVSNWAQCRNVRIDKHHCSVHIEIARFGHYKDFLSQLGICQSIDIPLHPKHSAKFHIVYFNHLTECHHENNSV